MIDRIKSVMEYYHLSPAQFADRIGFQRSALSHVLSGRNNPSLDFVLKVKNAFPNLNLEWLTLGDGNQFVNQEDEPAENARDTLKINLDEPAAEPDELQKSKVKEEPINISKNDINESETSKSQVNQQFIGDKKIKKIILLYNDGSFSEHIPEK